EGNVIHGFLGIATDITQQKEQQAIIEKQNSDLELLNKTKDKFFSIVAHDLKSPLNSLKAFSGLLADHAEHLSKEEIADMGKQLHSSVTNAIKMADNLITWARIQMNDVVYAPEAINVKDIIANVCDVYKDVARNKGISVACSMEDSLSIIGDKNQLEFVIRNLVNNAIKFTPKEGTVSLLGKSINDSDVEISISDSGVGMPKEVVANLFSIGSKQSTTGTGGEKGTGLGLMLSYEFLKKNGGKISVESAEGKGTTFRVALKRTTTIGAF
ncbi:MAG: sensor histidine kinase, partial [Bacteroidota bacterium]